MTIAPITHPENRLAGQKTASGFFCDFNADTRPKTLPQTVGTHLEGVSYIYGNALGCVEDPFSSMMGAAPQGITTNCVPLAWQEVLKSVTKIDPGDLRDEMARANGEDPAKHDWYKDGMEPTAANHGPVAAAHGAELIVITATTIPDLLKQIGSDPFSVSMYYQGSYAAGHQVTIRKTSNGQFFVTNVGDWSQDYTFTYKQMSYLFPIPHEKYDWVTNSYIMTTWNGYLTKNSDGVYIGFGAKKKQ